MLIFSYCITWIETTLRESLICRIIQADSKDKDKVKETETMDLAEEVCRTSTNLSMFIRTRMEFLSQPIDSCHRFQGGLADLLASLCNAPHLP